MLDVAFAYIFHRSEERPVKHVNARIFNINKIICQDWPNKFLFCKLVNCNAAEQLIKHRQDNQVQLSNFSSLQLKLFSHLFFVQFYLHPYLFDSAETKRVLKLNRRVQVSHEQID